MSSQQIPFLCNKIPIVMAQKLRQFCKECNQITTQTKSTKDTPWVCLCCEAGKLRSPLEVARLKAKAKAKPRLNIKF